MRSILAFVLLAPSFAMACPQLAGEYTCKSLAGEISVQYIDQREENGIQIYNDKSDDYMADGAEHPLDWGFFVGKYVATCPNDTLIINMTGEISDDEGKIGDIINYSTYKMADANTLMIDEKYVRDQVNGKHVELDDTYTCTRN